MDKNKAYCIDSEQNNASKNEDKEETALLDAEIDEVNDKPCSEELSEVTYDSDQYELVSSSYESDVQFWALVNSKEWKTAIRVGKGHLHRRLLAILHDLSMRNAAKELCTSQTYCKINFCRTFGGKWIPDHRLFSLLQNDDTLYRAPTLVPRVSHAPT